MSAPRLGSPRLQVEPWVGKPSALLLALAYLPEVAAWRVPMPAVSISVVTELGSPAGMS